MEKNTIKIVRKEQHQISQWAGGTTTQLMIYPEDADYGNRDFKWRVSSAKVELVESEFTHLPRFSRILMVVEGELALEHEGRYKVMLSPYQQDSFMGDWTTKSYGKVTDFNLMMAEGVTGTLEALKIVREKCVEILKSDEDNKVKQITEAFYIVKGSPCIAVGNDEISLGEGDFFSITGLSKDEHNINFYNRREEEMMIIRVTIYYND
ncbi:HutD protein [Anaerovirgula multivorans]|uniref:HutD protein n=1 Tax=Anaerovirgula multivorans TaxID=312168 RepID=A0A239FPX8_9FIRM|nr:HutD family protein [Anaerovirgula multivorans]SNS58253.1 HutD protein [Anaerovirgula multivorans]